MSHVTRHTSHVTRHASHVTRHTSHSFQPWSFSFALAPPVLQLKVQFFCRPMPKAKQQQQQQHHGRASELFASADLSYQVVHHEGSSSNNNNTFNGQFLLHDICQSTTHLPHASRHLQRLLHLLSPHATGHSTSTVVVADETSSCTAVADLQYSHDHDHHHSIQQQQQQPHHSINTSSILFFLAPPPPPCPSPFCRRIPLPSPQFHWRGPVFSCGCPFPLPTSSQSTQRH